MKKIAIILIILPALLLSGCKKAPEYSGYSTIEAARQSFVNLTSAKIKVTDLEKNLVTQELVFQIDENKNMLFRYKGTDGTAVFEEYHNGKELYYTTDGKWTGDYFTSGKGNYYGYYDTNRHSLASADIFYANEYAVNGSVIDKNEQKSIIKLQYDLEKLADTAKKTVEEKGNFVSFATEYVIIGENLTTYTQTAEFDKNGEKSTTSFKIEISEHNIPQIIEKPEF